MFFKKQKNKSGFTLVEILIVIAIIGILATIAVIAMLSARVKANDTKRVYDVSQIKKALDLYYFEVGKYPNESEIEVDGYLAGEIALPGESNQIYMHQIPTAPKADGDCTDLQNKYDYVKLRDNCAIVSNCTAENGPTVISVGDCSVTMASEGIGGGWI
ncbi:MAG: prepilin-type N-terminal cleavage/methylation domain-containing protein, partial [Patescibacteria group bacterium]